MKKYMMIVAMALATVPMLAQETYENAKVSAQDLNGTARYVGMGGAMEALGADISTISTNPAGIGLFRKSTASTTFGIVSQQDGQEFAEGNKTNMSFDQIGFVYAARSGQNSFLNFGFNYHKSRNFDYILSAIGDLRTPQLDEYGNQKVDVNGDPLWYYASQNKLTYAKQKNGLLFPANADGVPDFSNPYVSCNQLDDIYARNLNYDTDENMWFYDNATGYIFDRAHKGYVGQYDFNISGNINDRVYLGLTIGLSDINYRHYSEYTEQLIGPANKDYPQGRPYSMTVADERKIDGYGASLTAGVIFRPVEMSPFRVGLSVATPTWYDMKTSNYTRVFDNIGASVDNSETYEFKLYTPWKFGLSLGHTVGNYLAIGASYEYADYAHLDSRYKTGSYYDYWYGEYYDESESDREMNTHTKETLKGVSTLKLGLEYKPDPAIAVRFGYNYVSPMYKLEGYKDGTIASDGSYYSSATDYTNWKGTNRITCGVGYTTGHFNLDVAYQYSATDGEFAPFMNYWDDVRSEDDNVANVVNVSNKRHQLMVTLGYKF